MMGRDGDRIRGAWPRVVGARAGRVGPGARAAVWWPLVTVR